jgi:hypothetical protein
MRAIHRQPHPRAAHLPHALHQGLVYTLNHVLHMQVRPKCYLTTDLSWGQNLCTACVCRVSICNDIHLINTITYIYLCVCVCVCVCEYRWKVASQAVTFDMLPANYALPAAVTPVTTLGDARVVEGGEHSGDLIRPVRADICVCVWFFSRLLAPCETTSHVHSHSLTHTHSHMQQQQQLPALTPPAL